MNVSVGSGRYKTKKALREAVAKYGGVACDGTSMFESLRDGRHIAVGPCAYTNRKWYACVDVKDGFIVKVIS